jgi:hypothetical protein
MPYVWEAWIGQKISRCSTDDDGITRIVLEDGRGAGFTTTGEYFMPHQPIAPRTAVLMTAQIAGEAQ